MFRALLLFLIPHMVQLVECEKVVEIGSGDDNSKVMGEYWSDRLDGFA